MVCVIRNETGPGASVAGAGYQVVVGVVEGASEAIRCKSFGSEPLWCVEQSWAKPKPLWKFWSRCKIDRGAFNRTELFNQILRSPRENASETLPLIKEAYKDESLSKAQVFRWHSEFLNGRESVEDLERGGRPSTATSDESIAKVRDLLNSFPSFLSCALLYGSFRVHQPSFLAINDGLSSADPSLLRCFCQKSLLKGVHISPDLQRSPGHRCANETPGLSIGLHFC